MLLHGVLCGEHGPSLYNGVDLGADPSKHSVLNGLVITKYWSIGDESTELQRDIRDTVPEPTLTPLFTH